MKKIFGYLILSVALASIIAAFIIHWRILLAAAIVLGFWALVIHAIAWIND